MLKDDIESLVIKHRFVTFAELRFLSGFAGTGELFHPKFPNIVLWQAVSPEALKAITELTKPGARFYLRAVHPIVPMTLGKMKLNLPIAMELKAYNKPHWLPVVIYDREETDEPRRVFADKWSWGFDRARMKQLQTPKQQQQSGFSVVRSRFYKGDQVVLELEL